MTGLQALERNAPDKPPQPDFSTKQKFEYTRHGTTTLTAGLDVVTGQIVSPTLESTRTEPEFVDHIARTVGLDPTGTWIFVVDNLNTPMSESLVKWVAKHSGVEDDLGKKQERHPAITSHTTPVPLRRQSSHPLRVLTQAQFVAQPNRDRFWDSPPQSSPWWKLHFGEGSGG